MLHLFACSLMPVSFNGDRLVRRHHLRDRRHHPDQPGAARRHRD
jgi:hypothetical protein